MVCQNFLLSEKSFSFNFAKYFFSLFSEEKVSGFLVCYILHSLFWSVRFSKNLFLKRVLCMIALENVLVIKDLLFTRIYFSFWVHEYSVQYDISKNLSGSLL